MNEEPQIHQKHCKTCDQQFATADDFHSVASGFRQCSSGMLWFECQCGSTLVLKKGCYDWYDPGRSLSQEGKALFRDPTLMDTFPSLPSAVMKLQQYIRDPLKSSLDIGTALKRAPVLAAELLKQANNLRPGSGKINSLEHAVTYLGRASVSHLVLTATIKMYQFKTSKYQSEKFWKESYLTGLVCQFLGKKYCQSSPEDLLYLSGSLCNIGKLVGAVCYPNQTDKIESLMENPKTMSTWSDAEAKIQGPSHTHLGEVAGVLWGLPEEIICSILHHHQHIYREPTNLPQLSVSECAGFASLLCHWINVEPHRIDTKQLKSFQTYLQLSESKMEDLVNALLPMNQTVDSLMQESTQIN